MLAEFLLTIIVGFCGMITYLLYVDGMFEIIVKLKQHQNKLKLIYQYRKQIFEFLDGTDSNKIFDSIEGNSKEIFELITKLNQHQDKLNLVYQYRNQILSLLDKKDINFNDLIDKLFYLINKKDGDSKEDLDFNNRALLNKTRKCLTIYYKYSARQYQITVPYDANKGLDMYNNKVFLINDDKTEEDITQQSGVPYIVSAKNMGGTSIKVTNVDVDNDIDHTYEYILDKIPNYCEEVNK